MSGDSTSTRSTLTTQPRAGAAGHAARCEHLYVRCAPAAFIRAERMLGNAADADDVVHDVFLRLFEALERFEGRSQLSTYLYSAVTHACLSRLRNDKRRRVLLTLHLPPTPATTATHLLEQQVDARSLMSKLSPPLDALVVYRYLDRLSQREIGVILGCSHTHVAKLMTRLESQLNTLLPDTRTQDPAP